MFSLLHFLRSHIASHRQHTASAERGRLAPSGAGVKAALPAGPLGLSTRWLLVWLALAVLLGPTLGQMHKAAHALGVQGASQQALAAHSPLCAEDEAGAANGANLAAASDLAWVHALFAGHGPAECELLDQAHHGFAGPPAVSTFVGVVPESALPVAYLPRPRAVFVAASFDARAPPL